MNADKINVSRATDALVAEKVMDIPLELIHTDAKPRPVEWAPGQYIELLPVDHYSSDIAAAWYVLSQFSYPHYRVAVRMTDTGRWRCDIETHSGDGPTISASADAAELAICRAALLAVKAVEEPAV